MRFVKIIAHTHTSIWTVRFRIIFLFLVSRDNNRTKRSPKNGRKFNLLVPNNALFWSLNSCTYVHRKYTANSTDSIISAVQNIRHAIYLHENVEWIRASSVAWPKQNPANATIERSQSIVVCSGRKTVGTIFFYWPQNSISYDGLIKDLRFGWNAVSSVAKCERLVRDF